MRVTSRSVACAMLLFAVPACDAAPRGIAPWSRTPTEGEVNLVTPREPGGRFVIEGRVLGAGDSAMAGLTLYVYHVDRNGDYAPKDDPNGYVRIAGVLRTDAKGRYRVRSILPGQYEGPPHIHFEAWGPGLPARAWAVNLYMAPSEKPDRAWGHMAAVRRSAMDPARTETFVTRDERGVFHAHYDLVWSRGFAMPAHFDSLRRGLIDS